MKYPNGSESVFSNGPWAEIIVIKNCPCSDGKSRTVSRLKQPNTAFSIPGVVYVNGKTVTGFVTCNEDGYKFLAYSYRKNGHLLP